MPDKERLDWLERNLIGNGLVADSVGRWAVTSSGTWRLGEWSFHIKSASWESSIREAIDHAMEPDDEEK